MLPRAEIVHHCPQTANPAQRPASILLPESVSVRQPPVPEADSGASDHLPRPLGVSSPLQKLLDGNSAQDRLFLFSMTHSYRTFVRSGVSTKPGQAQRTDLARTREHNCERGHRKWYDLTCPLFRPIRFASATLLLFCSRPHKRPKTLRAESPTARMPTRD